jgi:D-3-phosphoglycerate dehydrogenase
VLDGLNDNKLHAYVCDFPSNLLRQHPRFVCLPHLGASTEEAEENCAVMVAEQVADYLDNGNILNAVNFPNVVLPRESAFRLAIANANVPNMLGQISTALAERRPEHPQHGEQVEGRHGLHPGGCRQRRAEAVIDQLRAIQGVLRVRYLPAE